MRGVLYRGPRHVVVSDDLSVPAVRSGRDAVVRVTKAGICGTDLHPYRGEIQGFESGTVMGHEFVGHIVEAGPDTPFAPGDRVFASDIVACGRCRDCARGWHYQCPHATLFGYSTVVGASIAGGQADQVLVPFADVVLCPVPKDVTDEQALLVGDVFTTAYAAVLDAGIVPGDVVGVVGAGPLGVLTALCARTAGAAAVLIADTDPARRELAGNLGADAVAPADFREALREASDGQGAQAVIEAVGTDAALAAAMTAAAPHATVVAAGAHHSAAMPFPSGEAFGKELTVRFTVGDPIRLRDQVLRLVGSGRLDPAVVVTHRLTLGEAASGYRLMDRGEALKVVLTP